MYLQILLFLIKENDYYFFLMNLSIEVIFLILCGYSQHLRQLEVHCLAFIKLRSGIVKVKHISSLLPAFLHVPC